MSFEMKYSIIVPIYKVEKYIEQCIKSILQQTYDEFELILVNDGSPDKCPEICDYYSDIDKRVKVIHKMNGGLVSARQAGCKIAKGNYVINVDGDDWIAEDYLEIIDKYIEETNPDILKVNGYYAYEGKNIEIKRTLQSGYYNREQMEKQIFPCLIESKECIRSAPAIWLHVVKNELYTKWQQTVPRDITIGEDLACTALLIANAQSIYVCNECLYYYRQNFSAMTKNKSVLDLYGPQKIAEHFERHNLLNICDFREQTYRITTHLLFNACVSQFNAPGKYKEMRSKIIEVLNTSFYNHMLNNCHYSKFSKGSYALYALKWKMVFLVFLKYRIDGR